ncbi:MAG: diguanylate cyclase [Anaerorhabdus sp.]
MKPIFLQIDILIIIMVFFNEFNIPKSGSVSEALAYLCNKRIAPKHRELVFNKISNDAIIEAYRKGKRTINCENLMLLSSGKYEWFEETVHIIEDEITGDIHVRCYIKNINKEKEIEQQASEERAYYEAMVSKLNAMYEFNITEDKAVRGYEEWRALYGIGETDNYTQIMTAFANHAVHPDDFGSFYDLYSVDNLLKAYKQGKQEVSGEYRRMDLRGIFIWVISTINLFEEPFSGNIMGFCYIKSIDDEKKEQLDLLYKAERDALTGFYNKVTVEEKISALLTTSDIKVGKHAFLMLDLDYFKDINDHFGHAFGDAFLSEMASKTKGLFREDDILGRVGGDEFVVFMRNVENERTITNKAKELCSLLTETYTQSEVVYRVSVSIGISLYPSDGKTYAELYHNADTALYYAKEHGRDQFAFYDSAMQFGGTSIKSIDSDRTIEAKIFEENISEYVFRILYESVGSASAIQTVLELIGKHYNVSRVYIFENTDDGLFTKNTFEWCADGISSQRELLQEVSYSPLGNYKNNLNHEGYLFIPNVGNTTPELKAILEPQGIKSMLQFSIERNGKFVGFMGLDQCVCLIQPTQKILSECRNMANVIGIFLTELRAVENAIAAKQMALSVVNGLASYAYVCNPQTHEVLFINERLNKLIPTANVGDICHKAFWASDDICKDCPMKTLMESKDTKYLTEMYNTNLNIWVKVTTSWIDWLHDEKACLVDSYDITKYIKNN